MNLLLPVLITITALALPASAGEPAGAGKSKYHVLESGHPDAPNYILGHFSEIRDEASLDVFLNFKNEFRDSRPSAAFKGYTLKDLEKHIATLTDRKVAWVTLGKGYRDDAFKQRTLNLLKKSGFRHIYVQQASGGVYIGIDTYIDNTEAAQSSSPKTP